MAASEFLGRISSDEQHHSRSNFDLPADAGAEMQLCTAAALILLSNETLVLAFAVVLTLGGLAGFWVSLARGDETWSTNRQVTRLQLLFRSRAALDCRASSRGVRLWGYIFGHCA
jgi:hypothetical protein